MSALPAEWSRFVAWGLNRPTRIKAALVVFLASIFQTPATPTFDAYFYWSGAIKFAHVQSPWIVGQLELRGIWTSALYSPAALLSRWVGVDSGDFFILLENSIALAILCALLMPAIVGQWRELTPRLTWAIAAITWLIVGRYAPYALTDFLEVVLALAAAVLLTKQSRWLIGVGGAMLFIVVNLRPAYLPVVVLLALLAIWFRRRATWPAFVGAALAAGPQTAMNLMHSLSWTPWPYATGRLSTDQSLWASFFVRYDTILNGSLPSPSLTWCDPHTARLALHNPPSSTAGLLVFYLEHLTSSVPLVLEKLGAVLSWPVAAPYYTPSGVANLAFSALIIVVAVAGAICVATRRVTTQLQASIWAIWIGAVLVIITSAPETRFSLPIVCCGIVGVMVRAKWTVRKTWVALALVALLGAAAIVGMQHPLHADALTAAQCVAA